MKPHRPFCLRVLPLCLPLALLAAAALSPVACGGSTSAGPGGDSGAPDVSTGDDGPAGPDAQGDSGPAEAGAHDGAVDSGHDAGPPPPPVGKLDLLFVVSNNPFSMPAQPVLQASVQAMIDRLWNPDCLDAKGNVLGASSNGACPQGTLEFQPVHDLHIGILSSALGGRGGDVCPEGATDPSNPMLSAHDDDHGELLNRATAAQTPLPDAAPSDFLAWFPSVPANQGQPTPVDPAITNEATLVSDFTQLLAGVGVHGCGFGAPLEAAYRFLVQPDPYGSITIASNVATLAGLDATVIKQRHDFLRPDSAVGVVVLSTEDERTVDPLAVQGQGWAFFQELFPGSQSNGGAPEGTIECQTNPSDPKCTSCAFLQGTDAGLATECPKDGVNGNNGYLDPVDDAPNLRTFHMKQRFGLDPEYPPSRYVAGLTQTHVPDSSHEHDAMGNYVPTANCVNPLFAASLPETSTDELCALKPGTRVPGQVFFTVITGVPHQLLQVDPTSADSPQKATLSASDWTKVLGADPLAYDFTGADFHMLESEGPRAASTCPPGSADDCDPISGREMAENKQTLQFACVFTLEHPIDCSLPANVAACACGSNSLDQNSPLCAKNSALPDGGAADGGVYSEIQIKGGAYPGIRELSVAKGLGAQAIVSSVCPIHTSEKAAGDPLYAHRPALLGLVDKLAPVLQK